MLYVSLGPVLRVLIFMFLPQWQHLPVTLLVTLKIMFFFSQMIQWASQVVLVGVSSFTCIYGVNENSSYGRLGLVNSCIMGSMVFGYPSLARTFFFLVHSRLLIPVIAAVTSSAWVWCGGTHGINPFSSLSVLGLLHNHFYCLIHVWGSLKSYSCCLQRSKGQEAWEEASSFILRLWDLGIALQKKS